MSEGFLEVGTNDCGEVVINHPDLKPDENGVGHIVFSPAQAINLAELLIKHARGAERELRELNHEERVAMQGFIDARKEELRKTPKRGLRRNHQPG